MIRFYQLASLVTLAAIGSWAAATSSAAPISTALSSASTGSELVPFTVSSIDIGQTMGTWSVVSGNPNGTLISNLNDGTKYGAFDQSNTNEALFPANGLVGQLTFSAPVDITSIESLTGSGPGQVRTGQAYNVQYSLDGLIFQALATVGGELNNNDLASFETKVTIVDSLAGPLAINVKALRFTFQNVGVDGESMYREIDVFGAATAVPEAGGLAIWSVAGFLGLTVVALRRRRQRA